MPLALARRSPSTMRPSNRWTGRWAGWWQAWTAVPTGWRMPREMWRGFAEGCGCVHKGIPQTDLRGVHGLRDLPQHYQTFQIFARSRSLDLGEMLPAPKPEDVVPALLQHLLPQGAATQGFLGKARCFAATVPAIPSDMAEPPPKRGRKE
mmetsp:Transcript_60274/g.197114  ORF Transcript_60274/g.197114 Transcript_60274/m.197114 type:complete len:150 (+) Transcript_60274:772-1221(+)